MEREEATLEQAKKADEQQKDSISATREYRDDNRKVVYEREEAALEQVKKTDQQQKDSISAKQGTLAPEVAPKPYDRDIKCTRKYKKYFKSHDSIPHMRELACRLRIQWHQDVLRRQQEIRRKGIEEMGEYYSEHDIVFLKQSRIMAAFEREHNFNYSRYWELMTESEESM